MRPLSMEDKGGVLVVNVGDGDLFNESQALGLRQAIYKAVEARKSPWVAIGLSGVDFLSSSGIALLIGAKRRVDAAGGHLVLFGLDPEVHHLFDTMKLTSLFDIAADESEALALFPAPPAP